MSERDEQELIERIARELREGVRFDASFDDRVMHRVRREGLPGSPLSLQPNRRATRWLGRTPRVRVNPLMGLATAAVLALFAIIGTVARRDGVVRGSMPVASAPDTHVVKVVEFVVSAPNARSVALVGDFNEWNPGATLLRPATSAGVWTIALPLPEGRHVYAFVVDGEQWLADPVAPKAPGDDFGVPNSVVTVGGASL